MLAKAFEIAINTNEVFGTHSQTQIREPHHANLTLNVSDSQNVPHAYCVNARAQQSPQSSTSGPQPTRLRTR
jgi:hypothetical protein